MTRLTNAIREDVVDRLIAERFGDRSQFDAEWCELADMVYCELFSAAIRKKMSALPKGWLPEETTIWFRTGTAGHERLRFSPDAKERRRFLASKTGCALFEIEHKVSIAHQKLDQKIRKWKEEVKKTKVELEATLAAVNTVKQLLEVWPEVEPYLPTKEKIYLPAVPREELNRKLGLPKEVAL